MKIYKTLILGLVLFMGCKEEIKPTLSDEKLVNVLTDLHLAEASMLTLNKKLKDSMHVIYYEQVFEIHQVQDSIFFKDLEIIRKDPKKVEELYTRVIDNLDQLDLKESEIEEIPEEKK